MSGEFVFSTDFDLTGDTGQVDFDLGTGGGSSYDREATLVATTRRPTLAGRVYPVVLASFGATTRRPTMAVATSYDINIPSGVVGPSRSDWNTALLQSAARQIQIDPATLLPHGADGSWSPAAPLRESNKETWRLSPRATAAGRSLWQPGDGLREGGRSTWAAGAFLQRPGHGDWQDGRREVVSGEAQWNPHPPHYVVPVQWTPGPTKKPNRLGRQIERWRDAKLVTSGIDLGISNAIRVFSQTLPKWNDGDLVPYIWRVVPEPPGPGDEWEHWGNNLCLRIPLAEASLDLGIPPCPGAEPPPEPGGVVPIRRVYFVLTSVSLTRLDTGVEVPATQLSISLDMDSWAWVWSASLVGPNAVALVTPGQDGAPVVVVADVNGHTWHLLAEDWTETREFGSRSIRVSGRGLSAWLGTPYEPAASGTLGNARTLAQAMGELLPLGSGWTLDWAPGTPDWLLPAGSWNWQNQSPIQAIHAAAQGVGLVVVPAMADKVLTVQPRYPVLPWHSADATPDLTVPDAAILSVSRRQAVPTQANAVYVHGGDAGGIIARVWRTGTAGDRLATTASAEQITQVEGARLLGERLLAGQGQQPQVRSFTLPLGGVFVLAQLGELVSLELGGEDVRGIVNAVAITAQNATVQQTVTIGEDTPNAWALWRRLLPDNPLLLGAVAVIHADGTRTVELAGGGRQRVRGESAVGTNVWVRSGMIEGQAPDLPSYEVEVF